MNVRSLTAADAALLKRLADEFPFKPFRNHRLLSRARQSAVLLAEIERARGSEGALAVLGGDAERAVIVTARPLGWDSAFFGVAMARIEHVVSSPGAGPDQVANALADVLGRLRETGTQHVAIKVDVADHDTITAAEQHGFRLMDAIVTYIAHPRRPPPRPPKQMAHVRLFQQDDTEGVLDITREAYRGYSGRFQLDRHLPAERSAAFYVEWARKCCEGVMADRLFVAEDAARRLVGWASVRRAEPVSSISGTAISAGSLGACRADSPGAYASLICTAAQENHAAGVLTEAMTQNSNFAMVRVLEAVGAQYARAEYTFHAWIG